MSSLLNKIVIITGGASGIGKSIAELFARRGATIHIVDIDRKSGDETVKSIESANGKGWFHLCNVADQKEVKKVFRLIGENRQAPDILVNNAGISQIGRLDQTREEDFDRVFDINVKGVYNCSLAVIESMKKNGGGVILNMASVVAMMGIPERFAYSMSKGAVLAMTYSIARDYIGDNIRCNAISPARVHTPFVDNYLQKHYPGNEQQMFETLSKTQPIDRMGKPEEIAALALFLCSDEAGFITGVNYPIDGGFTTLNS
ncbi:MAG: SDR family NAD(P)-dependent oxidoreductase [Balneolaceae bacterium]